MASPCPIIDPSAWEVTADADPSAEYVGLVSRLQFRGPDGLVLFQELVTRVIQQLGQSRGLLGWSMADSSNYSYLTLSAWHDETALRDFMLKDPHREAMRRLRPLAVGRFVRFPIKGNELPLAWSDAVARLTVD